MDLVAASTIHQTFPPAARTRIVRDGAKVEDVVTAPLPETRATVANVLAMRAIGLGGTMTVMRIGMMIDTMTKDGLEALIFAVAVTPCKRMVTVRVATYSVVLDFVSWRYNYTLDITRSESTYSVQDHGYEDCKMSILRGLYLGATEYGSITCMRIYSISWNGSLHCTNHEQC